MSESLPLLVATRLAEVPNGRRYTRTVICEDGNDVGTLHVSRAHDEWIGCLWVHDRKYLTMRESRAALSSPVWDTTDDELFIGHVQMVFDFVRGVYFEVIPSSVGEESGHAAKGSAAMSYRDPSRRYRVAIDLPPDNQRGTLTATVGIEQNGERLEMEDDDSVLAHAYWVLGQTFPPAIRLKLASFPGYPVEPVKH